MGAFTNIIGAALVSLAILFYGANASTDKCPGGIDYYGIIGIGKTTSRFVINLDVDKLCGSLFQIDKGIKTDATVVSSTQDEIVMLFVNIGITFNGGFISSTAIRGGLEFSPIGPIHSITLSSAEKYVPASVPLTPGSLTQRAHALRIAGLAAQWTVKEGSTNTPVLVYGQRAAADTAPMVEASDLWHIGSNTKSMTATLTAVLVERGLLTWHTPLYKLLKETVPSMREEYRNVTPLLLLSHRAGLQANIANEDMLKFSFDPISTEETLAERREYATLALRQPPVGPAAAQEHYSNNGYIVMGYALEVLTGKTWESLIQEHVFAPLGITSAGFGPAGLPASRMDPVVVPERLTQPAGHVRKDNTLTVALPNWGSRSDNPVALGPAGRVHISAADLLTYVRAHMDQHPMLKPATWDILHTPTVRKGQFALGWVVSSTGLAFHSGSNTANFAMMGFYLNKRAAAIVLANDPSSPSGIDELLYAALTAAAE